MVETKLLVGRDQHQVELIAEIEPIATARPEKIGDFEPGHAERPGREAACGIVLVKLSPESQAGLLEEVVGVVEVAHERINVTEELRLMSRQHLREFSFSVGHGSPDLAVSELRETEPPAEELGRVFGAAAARSGTPM